MAEPRSSRRGASYALLDLDYLSWAGTAAGNRAAEFGLMLQNLAAVTANYRRPGIRLFVLAYFVRSPGEVLGVREALDLPLRVVRLVVPCPTSSGGWLATSPATAATTCAAQRRRSGQRRRSRQRRGAVSAHAELHRPGLLHGQLPRAGSQVRHVSAETFCAEFASRSRGDVHVPTPSPETSRHAAFRAWPPGCERRYPDRRRTAPPLRHAQFSYPPGRASPPPRSNLTRDRRPLARR